MNEAPLRFGLGLKLLVPLLMISVFGLLTPLLDPRGQPEPELQEMDAVRTPYEGELAPLLESRDLLPEQREAIQALHALLQESQQRHGGITALQAQKVRQLLQRPR